MMNKVRFDKTKQNLKERDTNKLWAKCEKNWKRALQKFVLIVVIQSSEKKKSYFHIVK